MRKGREGGEEVKGWKERVKSLFLGLSFLVFDLKKPRDSEGYIYTLGLM